MINRDRNRMRFWSIVLSACLLVEFLPVSAFGAGESWENAAVAWVPQEQTQNGSRTVQLTADLRQITTEDAPYSAAMVEITLNQDEAAALQTQGLETVEESELTEPHEEESPPTTEAPPEETTTPTEEETVKTSPTPVEELSADSAGASGAMTDLGMSSTEIVAATDAPVPDPAPMPANSLENIPDTQESPTGDGEQDPSSELSPDEPKEGPDSGDPSAPHALLIETANGAVLRILLDEENPEFSEPSLTFVTSDADLLVDVSEDEDDIKVFGFIEDSAPYIYSTFDTRGGQEVTAEIYTEPMLVYRSMNPLVSVSADPIELELNGKNTDITYTIELSVREEDQTYAVNLTIPEGLSFPADSWSYQPGDSGAASGVILCGDTELLSLSGLPEEAVIGEPSAVGQNLQFTLTIPGIKESLWDRLGDWITGVQENHTVEAVLHAGALTRAASGINGDITLSVNETPATTHVTAGDVLEILGKAKVVSKTPFTQDVQWADNNSTSRPAYGTEFYPQLYFRIKDADGTTQWIELAADMLNYFGFNGTWPTITGTAGGFTIDLPNRINAGTEYANEFYDVEWSFAPPETPEGYVFYQRENDEKNTWYYIQSTEFRAALNTRWGNHEPTKDQLLAVLEQFTLHWSYGTTSDTQTLSNLIEEGYAKVVETTDGGWELVISDMWAYSVDDDPITFYIQESDNQDKTITADELNGALGTVLDKGDHLTIDYNNTGVPNVGDNTDAVYSGGALNLSRVGETTYSATKIWVDTEPEKRPDLTFDLRRYRAGEDISQAAPVEAPDGGLITMEVTSSEDTSKDTITIEFIDKDGKKYSLPKYDPDGYEYIYVVREYMEMGDGDNSYEQVFGTIERDKSGMETVTGDFILEYDEDAGDVVKKCDRPAGNTYLYNDGTLSNRATGSGSATVVKEWNADAYQANLDQYAVKMTLYQSTTPDVDNSWTVVTNESGNPIEVELDDFYAEKMSDNATWPNLPEFNDKGERLYYLWKETGVKLKSGGDWIEVDENGSFELGGNKFLSTSEFDETNNRTTITNTLVSGITYTVEKKWFNGTQDEYVPWPEDQNTVVFCLYQTLAGTALDLNKPSLILTLTRGDNGEITAGIEKGSGPFENGDEGETQVPPPGDVNIEDNVYTTVISNLPRYDENGEPYEYILLEQSNVYATYENEVDKDGNYTSTVTNHIGDGEGTFRIMVRKIWNDGGDEQHREPVKLRVYNRKTGEPYGAFKGEDNLNQITLGDDRIWYEVVWIPKQKESSPGAGDGVDSADDIYIVETAMGDSQVTYGNNDYSYNSLYNPPANSGVINSVTTSNHRYQVTYTYEKAPEGGSGDTGWAKFAVTNRRLGWIDIDVTKTWQRDDMAGLILTELNELQESGTTLALAVKLSFVNSETGWKITNSGIGDENGDTVQLGTTAELVPIQDKDENPTTSVQALIMPNAGDGTGGIQNHLYFYNLPKYDLTGSVVQYQVEEIWLKYNAENDEWEEVTDLRAYKDLYTLCGDYHPSVTSDYTPSADPEGEEERDKQTEEIHNAPSGTKDVTWTKQWKDEYSHSQNWRPDLFLNIYRVVHVKDENAEGNYQEQIELVYEDYRWTVAEGEYANDTWTVTLSNMRKYDDHGFEIMYYAVERTVVNASQFDYQIAQYAYDIGGDGSTEAVLIGTRDKIESEYSNYVLDLNSEDYSWAEGDKPTSESDYANYALQEDGTFINQLAANITISGEKIWESLPGHFLEKGTLPSIRLDVSRSVDGGNQKDKVATLTITSAQWKDLRTPSGAYQYLIQYEGENRLQIVDGELTCVYVPKEDEGEDAQGTLLPRYDEDGALYTYTIDETILFEGASDGADGSGGDPATSTDGATTAAGEPGGEETSAPAEGDVFDKNTTNGFRVVNTYTPATGSLTVKKHLDLPEDPEGFPAITFTVTQYAEYAAADGEQYGKTGATWTETLSADEVERLYRAYFPEEPGDGGTGASGKSTGDDYPGYVTDTVTFDNLPLYAPDGTEYLYSVEEVKDDLQGYNTWALEGDNGVDAFNDMLESPQILEVKNLRPVPKADSGESPAAQATFLNKYNEAKAGPLTATKTWEDLNDADGFRPDPETFAGLLTLTRSADTQSGKGNSITEQKVAFTVEWSDGWNNEGDNSGTFTIKPAGENSDGFEVYAPNGMPWKYTLAEAVTNEGRLELVSDSQDDVRNHIYTPDRAEGKWTTLTTISDTNNNFGNLINSITTHADFAKVWADENGDPLTKDYLGFELSVTFELQVSMDSDRLNGLALTDGEWISAAEAAEEYPSIQAALKANGSPSGTKTLTGHVTDAVWNGSFTGLPSVIKVEDADGAEDQYIFLKYRVVETAVSYGEAPHQTELSVSLNSDGTYLYGPDSEDTVIAGGSLNHNPTANRSTSTNRLSTLSVTARKVWQDSENLYATRPGGDTVMTWKSWFVLQRQAKGETTWENVAVFTLYGRDSADGTDAAGDERWAYTISDLPRVDEQNRTYEYRIRELQPREDNSDYKLNDVDAAAIVENTYNTGDSTYTTTYNNEPENDWTVTNTLDNPTEASEIQAVKEWAVPEGATTPESVTFELQYRTGDTDWQPAPYANAAQEVNADDNWTATWENLPKTIGGEAVQYQVVETELDTDWVQTDCTDATENGIRTITFYNAPMMSFSVLKKWVPGDGEHPAVTVALYRTTEREEIGRDIAANRVGDVVLSEASNWTHTFSPLPQYDAAAQRYYYYALELDSSGSAVEDNGGLTMDGKEYIATYDFGGTASSTTTITNTSAVTLAGTKRWTAADRPDITLTLQRKTDSQTDWEAVTGFAPVWNRSGDTWTFTYPYLPAVDPSGNAYTYRVQEEPLSGYDTVYTTDDDGWLVAGGDQSFGEIHNIQRGGLQVTKTVSGNTSETDREFHFTVTLSGTSLSGAAIGTAYPYTYVRQDGTTVQGSLTFTDGTAAFTLKDRESLTLTGIPAGITYQVTETEANQDGYTTTAGDGTTGAIPAGGAAIAAFHNHRSSSGSWGDDDPTTSVTGTKTWVDNGNAQGTRPDSLRLTLYRSVSGGAETVVSGVSPTWVKNGDVWTYTFSNLPLRDSAGRLYHYRVEETVPEGYTSSVSGYHFTNTLTTEDETISVSGRKYWRGDTAETRPDSIVVVLYANGQEVARQVVSAGQDWSYLFEELPKYDAQGSEITYTVREETVPEGYRVEYSGTDIINLSLDQDFSALRITKTVSGPGSDTEQAFHFTVTLSDTSINGTYGDLTFVNGVAEFSLRHGEEKTAAGLPAGIAYTVTEAEANQNGYTTTAAGDTGTLVKDQVSSAEFTNTKPEDPPGPTPTPDPGTPQTGDPSLTWLWAILCAASLCGFLALLALNQKKRNYRGKRIRK